MVAMEKDRPYVEEDEIELLVRVARQYYEQDLNQAEIARRLGTSRSTISRLLQRAREEGIVEISIHYPSDRDFGLEEKLARRFQLKGARVLRGQNRTPEQSRQGMGLLAAQLLDEIVRDGMVLGVSYGRSIASTISQMRPSRQVNMTVVQIIGALGSGNPLIEGPDLVRELANLYGATYRYLYVPLIVEDRRTRDLLVQEPYIQDTLALGARSDVVLIGIGALLASSSGLIWTGYLSERDQVWLNNIGGVGHMCAEFFDNQGLPLDIDLNKRTIGIGLTTLKQVPQVVAVAGTLEKARAIRGALRGGYIDTLVTDEAAARELLRLCETEPEAG